MKERGTVIFRVWGLTESALRLAASVGGNDKGEEKWQR
jgi:hypothetical protein